MQKNAFIVLMKTILRKSLLISIYSKIGTKYKGIRYFGFRYICSICGGHFRKFLPYGLKERLNARCPVCLSLERHRLLWLYLKNKTNLFTNRLRVLHFAPEKCISDKLRKLSNIEYITADIDPEKADFLMDITNISSEDNYYDVILCSHVLEHIQEDRMAMSELYRVLKPEGWAILQVPIGREKTFEDPNITSGEEREAIYGQADHVRIYGLDYIERLKRAGFMVTVESFANQFEEKMIEKYNLSTEDIYLCHKI